MNYFLDKKYIELKERVRAFAEKEIKPRIVELDEQEAFSPDLVRMIGKQGLMGLHIPAEYGGQGEDYLALVIAVEEMARVDSSYAATVAAQNSLGISPIYEFGTPAQKQKYLPDLCTGENIWALGITEPTAGSDVRGIKTTAIQQDDCWLINGHKTFITNSASSLSAGISLGALTDTDKGELSVILVERDTLGFKRQLIKGKMVWRSIDNGDLRFEQCKVPLDNLLGKRGEGARIMLKTLDSGRLTIAAVGLGLAQGAYEMAKAHANRRKQFGRKIVEFQSISFKLADMATKIELARNMLYNTCKLKDGGQPFAKEAAMIKLYTSEIAREVADEALQIHGAVGFLKDNHIERFYRDQRLLQIGEGTSEILRLVIARHILDKNE